MARRSRGWLAERDAVRRSPESRWFADDILKDLAAGEFSPRAWARFLARSLVRSAAQARLRPLAAAEVTAIHLGAWTAGRRPWAAVSWFLCVTHLGLLGERTTLGWPNRLTLLRALLPALAPDWRPSAMVALATDLMDGVLARRGGESAFGAFADPIADGVFWSSYALRWEKNHWLRWVPAAVFATIVGTIAVAYFSRARSIDYPRPVAFRFASAAAQIALALRVVRTPGPG